MSEMSNVSVRPKWRKLLISTVVGAVFGGLGAFGVIALEDAGVFGARVTGSQAAALGVGIVYLITGVSIVVGLVRPAQGARYLNVEDEDELLEQRPALLSSAFGMAAWGVALMLLAAAGPTGSVPPATALAGALLLFAIATVLTLRTYRLMDELMRILSNEAGNAAFYLVMVLGGGWAMLAHLGFAPAPAPLDWLSMFTAFVLLASFLVVGRRGMLKPR